MKVCPPQGHWPMLRGAEGAGGKRASRLFSYLSICQKSSFCTFEGISSACVKHDGGLGRNG